MARLCEVCGKGVSTGNAISHADNKSKRTWSPNVQTVRANLNGRTVRLTVCTRCLRSGKVQRAV